MVDDHEDGDGEKLEGRYPLAFGLYSVQPILPVLCSKPEKPQVLKMVVLTDRMNVTYQEKGGKIGEDVGEGHGVTCYVNCFFA